MNLRNKFINYYYLLLIQANLLDIFRYGYGYEKIIKYIVSLYYQLRLLMSKDIQKIDG